MCHKITLKNPADKLENSALPSVCLHLILPYLYKDLLVNKWVTYITGNI